MDLPWGPIFNPSSSVRSFVTSFSWDWTKGIFLILTQRCKMVKDLPATRSGNVPEKVFSGFFWNFIISFSSYFFFFDCVLVLPSMCRKPFSELFFTGRSVEPEILRKSSFFVFPWHFLIIYDYFFTEVFLRKITETALPISKIHFFSPLFYGKTVITFYIFCYGVTKFKILISD